MNIQRSVFRAGRGLLDDAGDDAHAGDAQLALVFGSTTHFQDGEAIAAVRARYPRAIVLGCSTAGEIAGSRVLDDSLVCTAVYFEHTTLRTAEARVEGPDESFAAGEALGSALPREGLVHVLVLSDGLSVNGSELVAGLTRALPERVAVTGGLAGDAGRFVETYVHAGGVSAPRRIGVVGFYGERLRVAHGSMGGWDAFGPERRVTRAKGHVLYELDGRSALDLYKEYLGPHAAGLPASALLFPLTVRAQGSSEGVVRTILAVNPREGSMTFAGDVPEGAIARLMHANFDRLVEGACGAAEACARADPSAPSLALMISCVGRKLVLKQRIEEEIEAALAVLGPSAQATGFYSYGEISPFAPTGACALHNQTMTITTFAEA